MSKIGSALAAMVGERLRVSPPLLQDEVASFTHEVEP